MTEIKALLLAGAGGRGPWAVGSELQRAEEAFANTLYGQSRGNFLAQREMRATRHELASHNMVLECCLEGVESAAQARSGGAHRIELCANLAQGGVTPSIGDIEGALLAVKGSRTKVHVLIRPRPGDFVYSSLEKQVMERDVLAAVKAGAHGVVIGALLDDGSIDQETMERLVQAAAVEVATSGGSALPAPAPTTTTTTVRACSVTFHRAFDCCTTEPLEALETLIRLGVDRVLTSGREASAWDGRAVISRLVKASDGRIAILPGAGVTRDNVKRLLLLTGAREVHVGSACQEHVPRTVPLPAAAVSLGFVSEGSLPKQVTARRVSEMLGVLGEGAA